MKTAEEIFCEHAGVGMKFIELAGGTKGMFKFDDVLKLMKAFAKEACTEQRGICNSLSTAGLTLDSDNQSQLSMNILSSPEPQL